MQSKPNESGQRSQCNNAWSAHTLLPSHPSTITRTHEKLRGHTQRGQRKARQCIQMHRKRRLSGQEVCSGFKAGGFFLKQSGGQRMQPRCLRSSKVRYGQRSACVRIESMSAGWRCVEMRSCGQPTTKKEHQRTAVSEMGQSSACLRSADRKVCSGRGELQTHRVCRNEAQKCGQGSGQIVIGAWLDRGLPVVYQFWGPKTGRPLVDPLSVYQWSTSFGDKFLVDQW